MDVLIECSHMDRTWSGPVPDRYRGDSPESTNENLFRLFNRVTEEDCDRLEQWGYNLPSLSVGDYVTVDGDRWQVASFGFTRVQ